MMKSFHKKIIFILIAGIIFIYCCYLFALPKLLSSKIFKDLVDDYIYEKTGINIVSEQLKVKTLPDITIQAQADLLKIDNADTELLQTKNAKIKYDLKTFSLKDIDIDYIYVNEQGFKNLLKKKNHKKKSKINLQKLPRIDVKQGEIRIDKGEKKSVNILIKDLKQIKDKNRTIYLFNAEIISDLLESPITLGKSGSLYYENGALYADNFMAFVGIADLKINGKISDKNKKDINLTITGNDIPIEDIMSSLLYFQKMKEPGKKFIENFYDYSGIMDINLKVNNNGVFGHCIADKLAGKTVLFDIPVLFPTVDFIFDEDNMQAEAYGIFGGEKVFSNVKMTDIATPNQKVIGSVHSILTDKFADKYVPDFTIKGNADASLTYHIKNKIINVNYKLKVPQNSDITYKTANLGLEDKERRLFVKTVKAGDELKITNYDYSTKEDGILNKIILGDGLFLKENGHLKPQYLTFKTQKDAPVSVTGSFYKYVQGGVFNGDLKYDFKHNKITGIFNIKDSKYKNFRIKTADINANEEKITISANGTYNNSPFNCQIDGLNNISKRIKIYNMNLFLDEYVVKQSQNTQKSQAIANAKKITNEVKKINVDVDKWTIKINKIIRKRLVLKDINVTGDIHNDIFRFAVPKLNFAKGIITANGSYNYDNRNSEVNISAKNIDSSIVADVVFELPDQIEGIANANIKAITKNGLDNLSANIDFSVLNGFLPQLGSSEFMIKKSRMIRKPLKFKLQDVVNIDLKNMQALSSDLKGNFIYDSHNIKNIYITSTQKYFSLLLEGDYNIDSEQADFNILGKYNKNQISKIKILFVPLSLILKTMLHTENSYDKYKDKLNEVPDIYGDDVDECAFRVNLKGNLNKNDVKVVMKRIK